MEPDSNAKRLHDLEQALAFTAENMPPYWRRMYENLLGSGFPEAQAMQVLMAYVHGMAGGKLTV